MVNLFLKQSLMTKDYKFYDSQKNLVYSVINMNAFSCIIFNFYDDNRNLIYSIKGRDREIYRIRDKDKNELCTVLKRGILKGKLNVILSNGKEYIIRGDYGKSNFEIIDSNNSEVVVGSIRLSNNYMIKDCYDINLDDTLNSTLFAAISIILDDIYNK